MKPEDSIQAKFKKLWMYYIIQSLLAAATLFIIILILGRERMVVASAIGATAFIVFAMSKSVSAQTRNVIGGHIVGLAAEGVFLAATHIFKLPQPAHFQLHPNNE